MRKKNAGALFMDFQISPDDRVGATPKKGSRSPRSAPAKVARGARVEPGFDDSAVYVDDERTSRTPKGKQPRGRAPKAKRGRGRRERKPLTFFGVIWKLISWLFILGVWAGVAAAGVIIYYAVQLPSSETWKVPDRAANIRIVAANNQLISNRGKSGGEAVSLRELPYYVPAAFVAIEDRRFYDHFGVDVVGLASVALESIQAGEVTRGASTITQQVAKNLFLTPDQTLGRKVQEALLAIWLEQNYSKDDILELYLNRMYFGHERYGIEAAAQFYFGKSARNLSLSEAAILAGSLQAPSRLNPQGKPDLIKARQTLVLNAMAKEGYISGNESKAAAIDPNQTIRTKVVGGESYVADWVESLMTAYLGDVKEDVIVHTTINWDLQKEAEFVIKEAVAKYGAEKGFSQGAMVAMDVDGSVRALVGGVDYQKSQFNRAVTARRQPGSTFKPFVYLAGMEKGYTPDTVANDGPIDINGWQPQNSDGKYGGEMTLRTALALSRNTVSALLANDVGPDKVVEAAMRMGISSPLQAVPSIALGTQEVSLLELTAAYAPFANGGIGVIANVITRIETADGKVLYDAVAAGPGRVIEPNIVAEMNDMLHAAVEIGTGKRAQLNGWPMAGKTGTSQKARDALFVGYTSRMVAGVWLGNDDDVGTKLSGGNVPVDIWSQFMTKAHEGIPVADLPGATSEPGLDQAQLQPMEQPAAERPQRTLVDLLGDIFGGN
ncbi:transglycosylase domain-containing protein [Devosia sp. CN2-171]|uniref:transglycosylase domain-containing protein n=1 Tax=Devosia sp. CN2-171 TaxID=3400909 RepID=UPI003BF868CD